MNYDHEKINYKSQPAHVVVLVFSLHLNNSHYYIAYVKNWQDPEFPTKPVAHFPCRIAAPHSTDSSRAENNEATRATARCAKPFQRKPIRRFFAGPYGNRSRG